MQTLFSFKRSQKFIEKGKEARKQREQRKNENIKPGPPRNQIFFHKQGPNLFDSCLIIRDIGIIEQRVF